MVLNKESYRKELIDFIDNNRPNYIRGKKLGKFIKNYIKDDYFVGERPDILELVKSYNTYIGHYGNKEFNRNSWKVIIEYRKSGNFIGKPYFILEPYYVPLPKITT